MRLLYEVVDHEHYVEILLDQKDVEKISDGCMVYKPSIILKRNFNVGVRIDKGDEDAVKERYF